jgi:hypothetical protein
MIKRTIIHELIQHWSKLTHATILRGKINSTSSLDKIELLQLNHDNFITDVGQQIKSPYYHKIIYSPNQIFPLVQIQLAKYLNKWMNRKSFNLA